MQISKEIIDRKKYITKFIILICSLENYCKITFLATLVFFLSPHLAFDTSTNQELLARELLMAQRQNTFVISNKTSLVTNQNCFYYNVN